jgi:ankyrin repeat protein
MDEEIYNWLKTKNTTDLLEWLNRDPAHAYFKDRNGVSLLMLTYYFRWPEVADHILSLREPVDIHEAVVADRIGDVKRMLEMEPSFLDSFSSDGFTPLGFAAYFCRAAIARLLVEMGAGMEVPSRNSFMVYPIHSAVAANCLEIVKLLLAEGASPNVKQQNEITPLHSAAHNGNVSIARLLIEHGADKTAITSDGKRVMDMAMESNSQEIIEMLRKN